MTEEEAKTKWCSFTRVGVDNDPTAAPYNRLQEDEDGVRWPLQTLCIASACMAWRWRKVANPDWKPDMNQMAIYPPRNPYEGIHADMPSKTDGFCGLAGQP